LKHYPFHLTLICFRYNPGERRTGNQIIGIPVEAKYGLRHDQVVDAYRLAIKRGAKRFGLHTMIVSNELNYDYMIATVRMLLEVMEVVSRELDIRFEFFNIGGGIGLVAAELIEAAAWTRKIGAVARPLFEFGNLGPHDRKTAFHPGRVKTRHPIGQDHIPLFFF